MWSVFKTRFQPRTFLTPRDVAIKRMNDRSSGKHPRDRESGGVLHSNTLADRANFELPADRRAVLIIAKFFRHAPGRWLISPSVHQNGHEIRRWDLSTWLGLSAGVPFALAFTLVHSLLAEGSRARYETRRKQEGRNRAGVIIGDA